MAPRAGNSLRREPRPLIALGNQLHPPYQGTHGQHSSYRTDLSVSLSQQVLESAIPDLREVPVDRIAELASPVLADAISLYVKRLEDSTALLNSFSSSI